MKSKLLMYCLFLLFCLVFSSIAYAITGTSAATTPALESTSGAAAAGGRGITSSGADAHFSAGGASASFSSSSGSISGRARSGGTSSATSTSSTSTTSTSASGASSGGDSGASGGGIAGDDFEDWLALGEEIKVTIGENSYILTVSEIGEINAYVTYGRTRKLVPLDSITFIDLNGDGNDDIKVKPTGIEPKKQIKLSISFSYDSSGVTRTIGKVQPPIAVQPDEESSEKPPEEERLNTELTGAAIAEQEDDIVVETGEEYVPEEVGQESTSSSPIVGWAIAGIAIVAAGFYFIRRIRKIKTS